MRVNDAEFTGASNITAIDFLFFSKEWGCLLEENKGRVRRARPVIFKFSLVLTDPSFLIERSVSTNLIGSVFFTCAFICAEGRVLCSLAVINPCIPPRARLFEYPKYALQCRRLFLLQPEELNPLNKRHRSR